MRAFVVGFMMAGALVGCNGSGPLSVAAQVEVTQNEARWKERSFHSYDFDLQTQAIGQNHNLHVGVRADTVASVVDNDTGQSALPVNGMTVDDVFADANSAITNENLRVTLEFDEQYGYPTLYTVGSVVNTPAGPYTARLSNLVPVH